MPRHPIRFGVCLPQHGSTWDDAVKVAQACDRLGYDSVWAVDHFFGIPDATQPIHEGWTEVTALAALTERVRLGHLVLCVSYRHPAVLAKMAATLDHVSNGRFILGMGAGWHQQEYTAYGLPFPSTRPRLRVLILDPHNEFAAAFPDHAVVIDTDTLDLPFWLMKLEEFAEVIFRAYE